jgi:hypothetical protein
MDDVELNEFVSRIKREFSPVKTLLFGSRARGDFLENSDYDIILVSEKFEDVPFLRRMRIVYDLWDMREHLDVICYTPKEFEIKKKEIGTVRKAIEEGVFIE